MPSISRYTDKCLACTSAPRHACTQMSPETHMPTLPFAPVELSPWLAFSRHVSRSNMYTLPQPMGRERRVTACPKQKQPTEQSLASVLTDSHDWETWTFVPIQLSAWPRLFYTSVPLQSECLPHPTLWQVAPDPLDLSHTRHLSLEIWSYQSKHWRARTHRKPK